MIVCKSCGAPYDEEEIKCPYCGGENTEKSKELHEAYLNDMQKAQTNWEKMPQQAARAGRRVTGKMFVIVVAAIAALFVIAICCIQIQKKVSYQKKQRELSELETLYEAGDYAAIRERSEEAENWSGDLYDKYRTVARLEWYVADCMTPQEEDYLAWIVQEQKADALYDIGYALDALELCRMCEGNYYVDNEQAAVEYYRGVCYTYLEQNYAVTETEIETLRTADGETRAYNDEEVEAAVQALAVEHLAGE